METKKKTLLLKKETVATLNDRSLHGIYGGTDVEEDGDGVNVSYPMSKCVGTKCEGCYETILGCPSKFPECKPTFDPGPSCGGVK